MGHTNSTVNYNLPQFVGTDKPSWLGDVNGAFLAIDTAIAAAKTEADSAAGGVAGLQVTVGGHTTQIGALSDAVTSQGGTLNSVTALIGNGTPTTTDQTIIGAINEINAEVNKGSVSVTGDGVKTTSQLFNELFALIDRSKITSRSVMQRVNPTSTLTAKIASYNSSEIAFSKVTVNETTSVRIQGYSLKQSGSMDTHFDITSTGVTAADNSSAVFDSTTSFTVYY
ncbi:MAG: hypothetical protein IIY21_24855 [Clostridiales bacterium]|nr:hypothetical protein [Clostridiales bacterium]MBQ1574553.1 hypothetical protein [Clostridiales bacterium]